MADQRYSKSRQIAEDYKTFLRRQRLKAGSRVGSVRKLMQMYNISLATADKVLRILADENFVYRTPSCGTFIKHDLQGELQIGFTENDYCSANSSAFKLMNLRRIKKALREENIVPCYVSYSDLLTPESAEKVFSKINALLLRGGFVDERTLPQLEKFSGPVVQIEAAQFPEKKDPLLTSWILPDYEFLLRELEEDIRQFRKLMIFSAGHPNAKYQERIIRKVFSGMEIETVYLDDGKIILKADNYFQHHQTGYDDVLLVMLSGFFSESLRRMSGNMELPHVLEFDNFEKSFDDTSREPVFTAIDSKIPDLYLQGVLLLKKLFSENSTSRYTLFMRPELVIRKTFTPVKYIKKHQNKEGM